MILTGLHGIIGFMNKGQDFNGALTADYRGAALRVEFDTQPSARLFINKMKRQEASADKLPVRLTLGSPVQTDYEWHEYIDALIDFTHATVTITLSTGGQQIATKEFSR